VRPTQPEEVERVRQAPGVVHLILPLEQPVRVRALPEVRGARRGAPVDHRGAPVVERIPMRLLAPPVGLHPWVAAAVEPVEV
jgi:hypothetical protein